MNQFGSGGVFPMSMGNNPAAGMYGSQMPPAPMGHFGHPNPVSLHFNPMAHHGGPRHPGPMSAHQGPPSQLPLPTVGQKTNASDLYSRQSRIYVGSVSPKITREQLISIFSKYGKVTGLSLLKGFAFVQYDNPNSARTAVARENNKFYSGMSFECNVVSDEKKSLPQQGGASGAASATGATSGGVNKNRLTSGNLSQTAASSNLTATQNARRPNATTGGASSGTAQSLQRNASAPGDSSTSTVSNLKRIAVSTAKSIQPPAKKLATATNNQRVQPQQLPPSQQQQQQPPPKPKAAVDEKKATNHNVTEKVATGGGKVLISSALQSRSTQSSAISEEVKQPKQQQRVSSADFLMCGQCRALFDDVASFQRHKEGPCEKMPEVLLCYSCNQTFTSPWALLRHAQNDHSFQIYRYSADDARTYSAAEGKVEEKSGDLEHSFEEPNHAEGKNGRTCDKFNRHSRSEDSNSTTTDKADSCNDAEQPDSTDEASNPAIQASSSDAIGAAEEEILLAVKDDMSDV